MNKEFILLFKESGMFPCGEGLNGLLNILQNPVPINQKVLRLLQ